MRGFPIAEEYRLFFFDGENLLAPSSPPADFVAQMPVWQGLAQRFSSRFLTMDVAPLAERSEKRDEFDRNYCREISPARL